MDTNIYQAIVSRALTDDNYSLALAAGGDGYVYTSILNYSDDGQAWVINPERNGTFSIFSKSQQRYMARQPNVDALILVDRSDVDNGTYALWRDEGDVSSYHPINSLSDWEQKINIHGNGPYLPGQIVFTHRYSGGAANELWLKSPIVGTVRMKSIEFSLADSHLEDETPMVAGSQTVTNMTEGPQKQTLHFRFLESHKYTFSRETGLKVSESVEFSGGLPLVGESKVKITVEGTWKFTEAHETADENEVTLDVPVTIPAQTAIRCEVLVLRANLNVPYKATVAYVHPDGSETLSTSSGIFSGVNSYNVVTTFKEMGTVARFERSPFNRLAATKSVAHSNGVSKKTLVHN